MPVTRRTQLLMDPKEFRRLRAIARRRKTSMAELIRSAVREVYLSPQPDRRAIVRAIANMNLPVPEWKEAKRRSKLPTPVFLDTNILLYAAGRPHPQKDTCLAILDRVAGGLLAATVNTEVVQEVLHVLTRKSTREAALEVATRVIELFPGLLAVTRGDMLRACEIVAHYPRIAVRDAVHAATMLNNGLNTIVSVDSDFDQIEEIRRILPSSV